MSKTYIGIFIVSLVVLGTVVYGLYSVGSPFHTRALKFDQNRVSDFANLKYSVENYYSTSHNLPVSLNELPRTKSYYGLNDPETNQPYEYKIVNDAAYKLCTVFSTDSNEEKKNQAGRSYDFIYDTSNNDVSHKKGYDCIVYTIPLSYIQQNSQLHFQSPSGFGTSSQNVR